MIGAIRLQTVLAIMVVLNLIGLTIAAFVIMRKK
jgi:Tfp pilus assembly protein PilX